MTALTAAPVVGIVADDLTGAADSAVQFARDGWTSRLVLGADDVVVGEAGSVTAAVTDARALDADSARAATRDAVRDLSRDGAELVFVKIDSTMRGSVGPQVTGALEAWRVEHPDAFAVVTPAYPAMGRTVRHGELLVDGARVETTAVGRDPVTPVLTSDLAVLVPGSVSVVVDRDDVPGTARRLVQGGASGVGIVVADAETDDDLRILAEAVALLGPRAVPVGSAGLAVAVSSAWSADLSAATPRSAERSAHVVVVMSSLHDASLTQYDHLVRSWGETSGAGPGGPLLRTISPTLDEARTGDLDALLRGGPAARPAGGRVPAGRVTVVLAPPRDEGPGAGRASPGQDGPTDAELVATVLAALTDRLVGDVDDTALVLVGGEGARAVLRCAGADTVLVHGALREGVPWGTLEGGRLHGRPVVTKAGGFGTAATIADVVADLLDTSHRSDLEGATS